MSTTLRRSLTVAALAGGLWLVGEATARADEPAPALTGRAAKIDRAEVLRSAAGPTLPRAVRLVPARPLLAGASRAGRTPTRVPSSARTLLPPSHRPEVGRTVRRAVRMTAFRPVAKAGTVKAEGRIRAGSPARSPATGPARAATRGTSQDVTGPRSLRAVPRTGRAGPAGATWPRTGRAGSDPQRTAPTRLPPGLGTVIDSRWVAGRQPDPSMVPAVVTLVVLDLLLGVALLASRIRRRRAGRSGMAR